MLKAVLFDAGGTLLRIRASVGEIYAQHAARHGVSIAPEILEARFGATFAAAPPLAFPAAAPTQLPLLELDWWRQVVRQVFHDQHFPDFEAFFRPLFNHFADVDAWHLFEDTLATLAALKQRQLKIAVVSNFDSRLLAICAGLGISNYADPIIASSSAGAAKPDPTIFRIALDRLRVAADQAVHIGDSYEEDVCGARAAGLQALLLRRQAGGGRRVDLQRLSDLVGPASPIRL